MKPASVGKDSMGPDILYDEFEKALSKLKNEKATGVAFQFSHFPAEILKALGCEGHWPRDFMESIIIPIEKKQAYP